MSDVSATANLHESSVRVDDAERRHTSGSSFSDYYRCPDEYAGFDDEGISSEDARFDLNGTAIDLRRDLSQAIDGLRLERYCGQANGRSGTLSPAGAARAAYYLVRPLMPVAVRRHLQKTHLRGWEQIRFPRWPVDLTVETLMQTAMALKLKARQATEVPFVWFWPDGARAAAIVTHDVEQKAGRDFCGALMDIDESCGFKASFQLVPEQRYDVSEALRETIRARGFEVNVHDLNHDGRLFVHEHEFLARAQRINRYAREYRSRGFRAGAMYRRQDWYGALEFSYDMSVPNVAHLEPQRGGCCTVMPYFVGNIVELPLTTIQDYSLFNIIGDYSIARWQEQIEMLVAGNGLITVLSHPDYLIDRRAREIYRQFLAHLRDIARRDRVWCGLPGDVDLWWRSRSRMTVVRRGDAWRIEGPDSHRARLAFATLEDDRIVYKVAPAA